MVVEPPVNFLVILEGVGAAHRCKGSALAALDFKEVLAGCAQQIV